MRSPAHEAHHRCHASLDKDVAKWLKENAPEPRHGQNYHQWLSGQYGLKKLVEHVWVLIGVSRTYQTMVELRQKMAELNGKRLVQLMLPIPNEGIEASVFLWILLRPVRRLGWRPLRSHAC